MKLFFSVAADDVFTCQEDDVGPEVIAQATHFGTKPIWVYNMIPIDWPHLEPRPMYGQLGMIPVGEA